MQKKFTLVSATLMGTRTVKVEVKPTIGGKNSNPSKLLYITSYKEVINEYDEFMQVKEVIDQLHPKEDTKLLLVIENETGIANIYKASNAIKKSIPMMFVYWEMTMANIVKITKLNDLQELMASSRH